MGCGVVLFISLLYFTEAQGLQHVFVQPGKDLYLELQKHVELDEKSDIFWKFNTKNNIGKVNFNREAVIYKHYEGRVELFNYSLLLKNVQHDDSGGYSAVVAGDEDQRVSEYKVIVQDPVSPVKLTATASSADSCNITVTCSTVDVNISSTFRCDDQNCSQVEEKSLTETIFSPSMTVYMQQDIIFCNHSNQVSWKQSNEVTKPQCKPEANNIIPIVITSAVAVAAFVIALTAITCFRRQKKGMYNREKTENTVYAVPEVGGKPRLEQNLDRDTTSTYCLVKSHTGPKGSTEPKGKALPESFYAQVERLPRS